MRPARRRGDDGWRATNGRALGAAPGVAGLRGALRALGLALAVACGASVAAPGAGAIDIGYQPIDVPDAGSVDQWEIRYFVSGGSFAQSGGFSILFPGALYASLSVLEPRNADVWDVIALQPDPQLPADGLFDAQAVVEDPSLAIVFSALVGWIGPGTPGPQAFEIYAPGFSIIDTGTTVLVPEPGSAALLAAGAAALAAGRRRGARRR